MALPRSSVLGIMVDNLEKRQSVLPLSKRVATGWAHGLNIPRGGETVLYTGHMYQLIPTIAIMAKRMAALENSWVTKWMGLGRQINKLVNLSMFMGGGAGEEQKAFDRNLRSIAQLLQAAGVEFGYLYERELYTGALIYDQAVDKVFVKHARRVKDLLEATGVRRIITVDPHTTNMLRHVYPEVLGDFNIPVESYLEVLAALDATVIEKLDEKITVHDSCVYARYENVVDQPRALLRRAGVEIDEPELSGVNTHCCGGPIESLMPARAHEIASKRVAQFGQPENTIATMCPICLINLRGGVNGGGEKFVDIADVLAHAYLGRTSA
jgi:Fe-S oxidoreductase